MNLNVFIHFHYSYTFWMQLLWGCWSNSYHTIIVIICTCSRPYYLVGQHPLDIVDFFWKIKVIMVWVFGLDNLSVIAGHAVVMTLSCFYMYRNVVWKKRREKIFLEQYRKWLQHQFFFNIFFPIYLIYVKINPFDHFALQFCVVNCMNWCFEMSRWLQTVDL